MTGEAILAANAQRHDDADDAEWDAADAVSVTFDGDGAAATGAPDGAVVIDGSTVTITAAGTYRLSGSLDDGQVVVRSTGDGTVRLVLDGVDLHSATTSPLAILDADEAVVVLAAGTTNRLSDEAAYQFPDAGTDEPDATLFSAADLTIAGSGSLSVTAAYNDAVNTKDGLVILGGTLTVDAVDDGLRGKDYVAIDGGTLTVRAGGDGVKSDDDEDATRGWISVGGATLAVTAGGDGLSAASDVVVLGGSMTVTSGGGHGGTAVDEASAKGLKGDVTVVVDGGELRVDAAGDALHSNGTVVVNGGTLQISTGDDALHADLALVVNGGTVDVATSYEGLESSALTIAGGRVSVVSSDDGLNAAGGNDGSGERGPGGFGRDRFATGNHTLTITGGTIVVVSDGDGLDINGSVTMSGGTLLVHGPTEQMNGAIDYDGTFDISGGVLVGVGSAGMAMAPSTGSTQKSLLAVFAPQEAGTVLHVVSTEGQELVTFVAAKPFESLVVSTPQVSESVTYQIEVGGDTTGTVGDGLVSGGHSTGGVVVATTTAAEAVARGPRGGGGRRWG